MGKCDTQSTDQTQVSCNYNFLVGFFFFKADILYTIQYCKHMKLYMYETVRSLHMRLFKCVLSGLGLLKEQI